MVDEWLNADVIWTAKSRMQQIPKKTELVAVPKFGHGFLCKRTHRVLFDMEPCMDFALADQHPLNVEEHSPPQL